MGGPRAGAVEGKVWQSPTGPVGPRRLAADPSSAGGRSSQWSRSPGGAPRSFLETLECPEQRCHRLGTNANYLLDKQKVKKEKISGLEGFLLAYRSSLLSLKELFARRCGLKLKNQQLQADLKIFKVHFLPVRVNRNLHCGYNL